MKQTLKKSLLLSILSLVSILSLGITGMSAQTMQMDIDASRIGAPISPNMYGVFFEDINFGADGGLYAELIKNRSFEFDNPFHGWTPFGSVSIESSSPCFDKNPNYVRLGYDKELTGTGLENEGFRGIGIKEGEKYNLTFYARTGSTAPIKLRINLVNSKNDIFETQEVEVSGKKWTKYSFELAPLKSCSHARLRITLASKGTIDMEHISLFPENTFNKRSNGMRQDLAQALKDLNPGVFRFPGGCIVEGTNKATRYQWKNTVGPVENRPININRWNYTFDNKRFPDYYQSYGLGFFEYFQLSEDLGAEPLPVLNCGLSCQYENEDPNENCPVDELQPYIDDALDLIEFANGSSTSKWGRVRTEMGHPAPFNLKYLAVGNEQWGTLFTERLEPFVKAIRAKYPDIKIIGSSGPQAEGKEFEFLWPEMKRMNVDLVDEHYYRSPEWFLSHADRYDNYDRKGPKVFAGEYACHPENRENSFLTALCEAAFMTGLERNADVVELCTYAPLFAHVDAWQWRPDLIWFDNMKCVKTPNYYVQQLYASNAGTNMIPLMMDNRAVTGQNDLYATAAIDNNTREVIVKIANTGIRNRRVKLNISGIGKGKHETKATILKSTDLNAVNTIENPEAIVPASTAIVIESPATEVVISPLSFNVYRVKM